MDNSQIQYYSETIFMDKIRYMCKILRSCLRTLKFIRYKSSKTHIRLRIFVINTKLKPTYPIHGHEYLYHIYVI